MSIESTLNLYKETYPQDYDALMEAVEADWGLLSVKDMDALEEEWAEIKMLLKSGMTIDEIVPLIIAFLARVRRLREDHGFMAVLNEIPRRSASTGIMYPKAITWFAELCSAISLFFTIELKKSLTPNKEMKPL